MNFILNIDKSIEASLYILNRLPSCDIHKLFKILYFSDRAHLSEYGRPITGDNYIAMKNGPVPSFLYDIVKFVRGDKNYFNLERDLNADFSIVDNMYIGAKRLSNVDYLSISDIECIDTSIQNFKDLDFSTLTSISHDDAWQKVNDNSEMKTLDIASAGGADIEMLRYIEINMQNQHTFSCR